MNTKEIEFLNTPLGKKYIDLLKKVGKTFDEQLLAKTHLESDARKKAADNANRNELNFRKKYILTNPELKWYVVQDEAEKIVGEKFIDFFKNC